MSQFLNFEMLVCALIGVAFALLWSSRVAAKAAYAVRARQIEQALTALESYEVAFTQFMELDAPESLKVVLADFSRIVEDEALATVFARRLAHDLRDPEMQIEERAQLAINELVHLRETRPGKAQLFDKAVASGIIGTALRWPNAGKMLQGEPTKLVIDREHEVAEAIRFTQPIVDGRVEDKRLDHLAIA